MKKFLKNYLYSNLNYKFFIKNYTFLKDLKQISFLAKSMRHSLTLQPLEWKKKFTGNTIIFAPHADDEIIGLGGTIINSFKNRSSIHCIYFSSSDKRQRECKIVSSLLKFSYTELKFKERDFRINKDSLSLLSEKINFYKPKRIFLPFLFDDHDDHRRVNQFLTELIKKRMISKEFEIWAYQVYSFFPTNVYVDITKNIKKKIYYLKKYKSQIKKKNLDHLSTAVNAYNSRFINTSKKKYLENFFVLPINEYFDLCKKYFKSPRNCYYNKKYF